MKTKQIWSSTNTYAVAESHVGEMEQVPEGKQNYGDALSQ